MESHGVPGKIQVTAAVYEAAKDRFDFQKRGSVIIKGKGAMTTYYLVGRRFPAVHPLPLRLEIAA
jgi:class 3 adenylate cyclase